ncbi:MAG: antitoxin Xre/MbcA/ParS toxin-binding domain-containing protein [Pseudomonadota bacterium]
MTQPTHLPTDPLERIFAYRAIDLRDRFPQPLETFREALECLQSHRSYMAAMSGEIIAYLRDGYSVTIPDEFFIRRSSEIDAALVAPEENDAVCAEVEAWLRATLFTHEKDLTEVVPEEERPYNLNQLLEQCYAQAPQPEDLQAWHDMPDVGRELLELLNERDVWAAAETVFGDKAKAQRWMTQPLKQLNDRSPEEALDEDPQQVYDMLIRIDHGVYM